MSRQSGSSFVIEESAYTFGGFKLERDGTLRKDNNEIHLPPKELAALRALLAKAGHIVTTKELKTAVWGDVHVSADSVPRCISSLRTALAPTDCIQTVYKRGYRLVGPAQPSDEHSSDRLPRLAILPFKGTEQVPEHLGAAIAEDVMARLSGGQEAHFSILARDSVFTLAQRGHSAERIGRVLYADFVLAGSLRAGITDYRLRVEMIRVEDETQVWVEDFLVPQSRTAGLETVLVQRLIARFERNGELSLKAHAEEDPKDDAVRLAAFRYWQRGRQDVQSLRGHRMRDGVETLWRAAELDGSLTGARVTLVYACVAQEFCGLVSPVTAMEQARRAARTLPENDESGRAILPALGWMRFHFERNLKQALEAFEESDDLPHDPWRTRARVMFALSRKRFGESMEILNRALHVDPYAPWLHARLAWALHLAGEAAESMRKVHEALMAAPDGESACFYGSIILAYNGEADRAVELADGLVKRSAFLDLALAAQAYALARAGRRDEAEGLLERLQWLSRERYVSSSFIAAARLEVGDATGALAELRGADEARCPWFFQTLADPRLKALHTTPEFVQMQNELKRMESDAAR